MKKILLGLIILIAIPFIVALFLPTDYHVERTASIDRPIEEVFNYVKFLKNQDNFSTWAAKDPGMKKTFTGTDGTVGFISAWESDNKEVGVGEQEITKIVPNKRLEFELRFKKPFESTAPAFLATESLSPNQTKIIWGFDGHMAYPSNLFLLFMDFDKMIGKDFEDGLTKLKGILESQPIPQKNEPIEASEEQ